MRLNTISIRIRGLSIRDLPEFCGPDDLADVIISLRESDRELRGDDSALLSPISDDGIRRLIKLAYYASFAAEEGRYPRFRLINTKHRQGGIWSATALDAKINDVESLRRLAPALTETNGALLVAERDGTLLCTGTAIVNHMGYGTRIGRPEIVNVGRSPSLLVRVDDPGRLRVTDIGPSLVTFLLDRGRIEQVVDYWFIPQIRELWNGLADRMVDTAADNLGPESRKYFGGSGGLSKLIHKSWSSVLATAIDKRHGGAFVVLPAEKELVSSDIHCKFPAQMTFGEDILHFWESCLRHAMAENDREREKAERRWQWRRATIFEKAEILAGLSAVDGCVVLDRKLQVRGFGGKIRLDKKDLQEADSVLWNVATDQRMSEEVMEQYGTRHQSAFQLAKVHEGAIVFVISQDGDLRIFLSDADRVYGYDRLHAWVHQYESM